MELIASSTRRTLCLVCELQIPSPFKWFDGPCGSLFQCITLKLGTKVCIECRMKGIGMRTGFRMSNIYMTLILFF